MKNNYFCMPSKTIWPELGSFCGPYGMSTPWCLLWVLIMCFFNFPGLNVCFSTFVEAFACAFAFANVCIIYTYIYPVCIININYIDCLLLAYRLPMPMPRAGPGPMPPPCARPTEDPPLALCGPPTAPRFPHTGGGHGPGDSNIKKGSTARAQEGTNSKANVIEI